MKTFHWIHMARKSIRCSTSVAIRKIQIKTTKKYYYISITRVKNFKKITETMPKLSEDVEKLNFSYTTSGVVKHNNHFYNC